MYPRKWIRRDPDTDIFHRLLGNDRTRPTILFLWDQLFEAEAECYRIEEYCLGELENAKKRVADLEARFLKDSHNSSNPPSSDFPAKPKRTRSLRERSGLNPGAQPGHPGHALAQVPDPDETRIHPVHTCARCGARLKPLPLLQHEVRQVIDLYQSLSQPHALCNAHHLRELTFVWELEKAPWATAMKEFLQQSLHHLHRCESRGKKIQPRWIRSRENKYGQILRRGYRFYGKTMPRHPVPARAGPQIKREIGHKLLSRLHFYREETLAFLKNPGVPFTNSLAERDLRMSKVKQKIPGCFRSFGGAKAFCRIRSFLSTAIKQGRNPFKELANIFAPSQIKVPT